jgi:hypothetical protein
MITIIPRTSIQRSTRFEPPTNLFLSQAFRRLNAVSVPKMVGVPNNAEEDAKRGN